MAERSPQQPGGVKFVLLHHGPAPEALVASSTTASTPKADAAPPSPAQLDALQRLLLALQLRYPAAELGAHRQIRGDRAATCPGRRFPMAALAAWARTELPRARDAAQQRSVEEQYSKL